LQLLHGGQTARINAAALDVRGARELGVSRQAVQQVIRKLQGKARRKAKRKTKASNLQAHPQAPKPLAPLPANALADSVSEIAGT
jgi:hypothetical protein